MRNKSSSIDEIIQQAIRRGEFDNLPGKGKPLKLDKNPYEDPEWGMAYDMIQSSGFSLPWMEKRKEIEADLQIARKALARTFRWTVRYTDEASAGSDPEWIRALSKFRERVNELNKRIRDYNLEAPSTQFQIKTINVEREVRRIEE